MGVGSGGIGGSGGGGVGGAATFSQEGATFDPAGWGKNSLEENKDFFLKLKNTAKIITFADKY